MGQNAQKYMCGKFLGYFEDPHASPPPSDDDLPADEEAEKWMPKDYSRAKKEKQEKKNQKGMLKRIRNITKGPDASAFSAGWGMYVENIEIKNEKVTRRMQAVRAARIQVTPPMIDKLSAFGGMLHTLEITSSHLKEIPKTDELEDLAILRLSHNDIKYVDSESKINERKSLTHILLEHNRVESIEERVITGANLEALCVINLSHNRLSYLPPDFVKEAKKLSYLDLSCNQLERLPESITTCKRLQLLFLTDNQLGQLPESLDKLKNLRKLFLSYNNLTSLPETIGSCTRLEKLRVSSNYIQYMPKSIVKLWQQKEGRLDEFLVDGNPLVQPSITAFQMGGLNTGFKLFEEWIMEMEEERQKLKEIEEDQEFKDAESKQKANFRVSRPSHETSAAVTNATQMTQVVAAYGDTMGAHMGSDAEMTLSMVASDDVGMGGMTDAEMDEVRGEVEASAAQRRDVQANAPQLDVSVGRGFFFEHVRNDPMKQSEIRAAESALLLHKKSKYIEKMKVKANMAKKRADELKKPMPRHLEKFIKEDFDISQFKGKVPVTDCDLHFNLLVFVTKPKFVNCAALFSKYKSQEGPKKEKAKEDGESDVMKKDNWIDLCTHMKVKLSPEMQQEMWDLLVRDKQELKRVDFIAGFHIHDVEERDPWISRVAKVLKLDYYEMDVEEMRTRLAVKSAQQAELHASAEASEDEEDSDDGDESGGDGLDDEQANKPVRVLGLQPAEGERRAVSAKAAKGGATTADAAAGDKKKPSAKQISIPDDEYRMLMGARGGDSDAESFSSDDSVHSSAMSIATDTTDKSFEASDTQHNQSAVHEELAKAAESQSRRRVNINSDADLMRLMTLPRHEILRDQATAPKERKVLDTGKDDRILRELRSKSTKPDPRFHSDVFTVRAALRECHRNMPHDDFVKLINFMIRGIKLIQRSAHPSQAYWHVNDPTFRHNTGILFMNPYCQQLLQVMGFICISNTYWVWPEKHLDLSKEGGQDWGGQLVPRTWHGRNSERLGDMDHLLFHCQLGLLKQGSKFNGHLHCKSDCIYRPPDN